MKYANWMTKQEIKEITTPVNKKTGEIINGLPIMHENDNIYLYKDMINTLVVGSTGSGKTQTTILPLAKLSMYSGESMIINDIKGELYQRLGRTFGEKGYNVIAINLEEPNKGKGWNPLEMPAKLYKEGKKDIALKMTEDIGYYLFEEKRKAPTDPFWVNSTISYFTGIAMYLYEKGNEKEITLSNIYSIAQTLTSDFLKKVDKNSPIYMNLVGTLNAPPETKGSILSTFNQKIKTYINKESLTKMMEKSDFDINKITKEKTAIFLISGISSYSTNLIPLFINQVFDSVQQKEEKGNKLNILLDEFDELLPIKDFSKLIHYSRSINIRYTVIIKSFLDLINIYGPEDAELIKECFNAIVYLLSNNIKTLEEISKMCGRKNEKEMLITSEELKTLDYFEAIILLPRVNPIRTKLLPDFQTEWPDKFDKTV